MFIALVKYLIQLSGENEIHVDRCSTGSIVSERIKVFFMTVGDFLYQESDLRWREPLEINQRPGSVLGFQCREVLGHPSGGSATRLCRSGLLAMDAGGIGSGSGAGQLRQ